MIEFTCTFGRSGGMVDAAVSKTVEGQLSCRFDSDLRHQDGNAELCSGSTGDFGSLSPGSNPGSAAKKQASYFALSFALWHRPSNDVQRQQAKQTGGLKWIVS
jgi:hypothetical protein